MQFVKGELFHIYNQGNNRQLVFFTAENYSYFLRKIKQHISPFADILAFCLMPNHFHLMVYVNETEIQVDSPGATLNSDTDNPGATQSRARNENITLYDNPGATQSRARTTNQSRARTISLNASLGVMLASYTRAINKQEYRTGSLFRKETKAISLNGNTGLARNWFISSGIAVMNVEIPEWQYPQVCFNYIHLNPVEAGLVSQPEDWDFSSYHEIYRKNKSNLINYDRIKEYGLIPGAT